MCHNHMAHFTRSIFTLFILHVFRAVSNFIWYSSTAAVFCLYFDQLLVISLGIVDHGFFETNCVFMIVSEFIWKTALKV